MQRFIVLQEEVVLPLLPTHPEIKGYYQDQIVGIHLKKADIQLTEDQAAYYSGCCKSTLYKHRKHNLIDYIRRGRRIYYTKEALDRYLEYTMVHVPKAY